MSAHLDPLVKDILKELVKHAERDHCFSCRQILREFCGRWGLNVKVFLKEG